MSTQIQRSGIHPRSQDARNDGHLHLHIDEYEGVRRVRERTLLLIPGKCGATDRSTMHRLSRWLIKRDLFDRILIPEWCCERGMYDSAISNLEDRSVEEQAKQMGRLLDEVGEQGPITAMGLFHGGPVALTLAALDERIIRVILFASSVSINESRHLWKRLLTRRLMGALQWLVRHTRQRHPIFLELEAISEPEIHQVPEWVQLEIPVLQVIGSEDEIWDVVLQEEYYQRLPNLHCVLIVGMGQKDATRHVGVFLKALADELRFEMNGVPLAQPT